MRIWRLSRISPWTNVISFVHNDIHRSLSEIIMKLFADSTNCFISDKDFNSLEKLVERELNKLQKWINANKLTTRMLKNVFQVHGHGKVAFI